MRLGHISDDDNQMWINEHLSCDLPPSNSQPIPQPLVHKCIDVPTGKVSPQLQGKGSWTDIPHHISIDSDKF